MINYKQNLSIRLPDEWDTAQILSWATSEAGVKSLVQDTYQKNSGMAFDFG
ncbi:hypothetical protein [Nostoc sp. C057]|uniref:hypothetical protein n=1 Tax=Nostoc sp. C057 TaxID=2576903 RepID=UPI0015C30D6F|nr:hypothetical protein [Nostoc sp. C057]